MKKLIIIGILILVLVLSGCISRFKTCHICDANIISCVRMRCDIVEKKCVSDEFMKCWWDEPTECICKQIVT